MENLIIKQLGSVSAIALAVVPATVLGCAPIPGKQSTGGYRDDTVITTKVKAATFNEPSLKSSEINVATFTGVVQLAGFVQYQADISKTVEVARSVNGVTSVKYNMRLK